MKKITLLGHDSRNDNLGVGALTVAHIDAIRAVAKDIGVDVQIDLLMGASDRPSCIEGADVREVVVRPLRAPWEVFGHLRRADVVFDIAGGDSFTDIYGRKRIFQGLMAQYLAHLAGRALVFAPMTLGPFNHPVWRRLAKTSMKRAAILCARDEKSTAFIREMGLSREIVDASDVALRLPYDPPEPRAAEAPLRIGLNVSGLLMAGGYTGKNMFGLSTDYPKLIRDLVTHFSTQVPGAELHLVGHVIPMTRGGVEDDYQTCLDLAQEFPGVVVAPAFTTPSEAKTYIAGLDFFMGARMHACIAAFSSGVPVVPMAYSRKFEGLFNTLGYRYTVDCITQDTGTVFAAIVKSFEQRETLAKEAGVALGKGRVRLARYDAAIADLLRK